MSSPTRRPLSAQAGPIVDYDRCLVRPSSVPELVDTRKSEQQKLDAMVAHVERNVSPWAAERIADLRADGELELRACLRDVRTVLGDVMGKVPLDRRPVDVPALRVSAVLAKTEVGCSVEDPVGALRRALGSGADVVVAPEWFFSYRQSADDYTQLVRELVELSRGFPGLLVPGTIPMTDRERRHRNIALALCDGRILCHYAKRVDGGDAAHARNHHATWEPGVTDGVFEWRGLQVGLEVCADHGSSRLRWSQLGAKRPLDVQLVVASGIGVMEQSVAVGSGGVVVCVDGCLRGNSGAYRTGGRTLEQRWSGRRSDEHPAPLAATPQLITFAV